MHVSVISHVVYETFVMFLILFLHYMYSHISVHMHLTYALMSMKYHGRLGGIYENSQ